MSLGLEQNGVHLLCVDHLLVNAVEETFVDASNALAIAHQVAFEVDYPIDKLFGHPAHCFELIRIVIRVHKRKLWSRRQEPPHRGHQLSHVWVIQRDKIESC